MRQLRKCFDLTPDIFLYFLLIQSYNLLHSNRGALQVCLPYFAESTGANLLVPAKVAGAKLPLLEAFLRHVGPPSGQEIMQIQFRFSFLRFKLYWTSRSFGGM